MYAPGHALCGWQGSVVVGYSLVSLSSSGGEAHDPANASAPCGFARCESTPRLPLGVPIRTSTEVHNNVQLPQESAHGSSETPGLVAVGYSLDALSFRAVGAPDPANVLALCGAARYEPADSLLEYR